MLHQALDRLKGNIAIGARYDNYIGGKWVAPVEGRYFDNPRPADKRAWHLAIDVGGTGYTHAKSTAHGGNEADSNSVAAGAILFF